MDKPVAHPAPPPAEQRPYSYERHGVTIEDPWHWIRDQGYPQVTDKDVLAYLTPRTLISSMGRAAQSAARQVVRGDEGPHQGGRILGPDPRRRLSLLVGVQARRAVPDLVRASRSAGGDDQIIFDEPTEAEGKEYFRLGALDVSPDGKLAAILVDDSGAERFTLRIRDLATGKDIETVTDVGIGQPVWTSGSDGIVFTEVNDNWRSYRARFHRLGTPADQDVTLYEETEELGFSVGVGKSQDRSLIIIGTGDNATSEVRFVSADDPTQPLTLVSPRKESASTRSMRRTGNCGSSPTTNM